uniref:HDC07670 n=1 Tax=Drosophila melanogaster TaxID=7227 RepID=Q6IM25_DROME|nr:TPA_inf: HDC07670 [Drosophila melanogaster]
MTLEKEHGRRPAIEVKVIGVQGLVRSRSERQELGPELREFSRERRERREASRDWMETTRAAPQDYVKVAKQMREELMPLWGYHRRRRLRGLRKKAPHPCE